MSKGGTEAPSVGFTIIEVMVVLAVSSLLVISAIILINGRQQRAEFTTGINSIRQQIQQIINETASGFFPNTGGFGCTAPSGQTVQFASASAVTGGAQGSNIGCIFLGKGIQFGLSNSGDETQIAVVPVVGRQYKAGVADVEPIETLADAVPRAARFETGDNSGIQTALNNLTVSTTLPYGLHVAKQNQLCTGTTIPGSGVLLASPMTPAPVCYAGSSGTNSGTGMILFLAGDSSGNIASSSGGELDSGAQSHSLYAVGPNTAGGRSSWTGDSPDDAAAHMGVVAGNAYTAGTGYVTGASKALICITDDTQSGLFTITAGLSVDLQIFRDTTC
jgi:prepilin-type N-terminal cleavage/methylation domain-containing protein